MKFINTDESEEKFSIGVFNAAGLCSKYQSIENVAKANDLSAVVVTETHYSGKSKPFLSKMYKPFWKNRSRFKSMAKGGVSIFLDHRHADQAVLLDTGENNEEEYVAVKINCYQPALIIFAVYGPQQRNKKDDIIKLWTKYTELWKNYINQGADVLICGDLNAALGNRAGMTRNDESINKSGELVLKAVEELGLHVLNKMEGGCQRTHIDRNDGTDWQRHVIGL